MLAPDAHVPCSGQSQPFKTKRRRTVCIIRSAANVLFEQPLEGRVTGCLLGAAMVHHLAVDEDHAKTGAGRLSR